MIVHTIGHGTLTEEAFESLVHDAGIARIIDVRSFPGSRRNPQFAREAMELWLPNNGIAYTWIRALGGRRRPSPQSKNVGLRNDAFRGYADYMETPTFTAGVDDLLQIAQDEVVAVMCSESLWWRCHRRLLADNLVLLHDVDIAHLMHDGRLVAHPLTEGARVDNGVIVYDA